MTDRELLAAAAKAADLNVKPHPNRGISSDMTFVLDGKNWHPINDDGDALRLAAKLRLNITFTTELGRGFKNEFMQVSPRALGHLAEFGPLGSDPSQTLRLAIVRAAAAIGAES